MNFTPIRTRGENSDPLAMLVLAIVMVAILTFVSYQIGVAQGIEKGSQQWESAAAPLFTALGTTPTDKTPEDLARVLDPCFAPSYLARSAAYQAGCRWRDAPISIQVQFTNPDDREIAIPRW